MFPISRTVAALILALIVSVQSFAPAGRPVSTTQTTLNLLVPVPQQAPPPTVETFSVAQAGSETKASPVLNQGIDNYLSRCSSVQVALQERKIPTKEEIEAKKRNFNVIFWGKSTILRRSSALGGYDSIRMME